MTTALAKPPTPEPKAAVSAAEMGARPVKAAGKPAKKSVKRAARKKR